MAHGRVSWTDPAQIQQDEKESIQYLCNLHFPPLPCLVPQTDFFFIIVNHGILLKTKMKVSVVSEDKEKQTQFLLQQEYHCDFWSPNCVWGFLSPATSSLVEKKPARYPLVLFSSDAIYLDMCQISQIEDSTHKSAPHFRHQSPLLYKLGFP